MAERLNDRVLIRLSRGDIKLPWDSRVALLNEIRHLETTRPIVDAFEAVGTSRPVELTPEQKRSLIELIEFWGSQVAGGLTGGLPKGVFELRSALHDDLHDEQQREQG